MLNQEQFLSTIKSRNVRTLSNRMSDVVSHDTMTSQYQHVISKCKLLRDIMSSSTAEKSKPDHCDR